MINLSKPYIGEAEKLAVMQVLDSGMLVQGPRTAQFEEHFAQVSGTKFAIATSSGTTALHVALLAHQIGPGDEVITTPFTFFASISSILYVGARPVFVDIEPGTFNLDVNLIEAAITPRTRAIMPVHLYGYMVDMGVVMDIAERHHLVVIEDAAQAVGATYFGKPAGSFGTGCFSLYATKNIMSGEGGMITTNDPKVAERARMLRNHGMQRRYYHDMLGFNFRMTDINAAIGDVQLNRLQEFTSRRRENAAYLNARIHSVITPEVREGYGHVWHQYTVRAKNGINRDDAIKKLSEAGVGSGIFYPVPAYRQTPIVECGYGGISLPVTEKIVSEVFSLPVHPQLTTEDLDLICASVNKL
jgi:perosamine synthetase